MKKYFGSKRALINVILLVILLLISGIYYVSYLWDSSVEEYSGKAIKASKLIISALDLETLKKLRGVPEEVGTIPYENIKKKFIDIRSNLSDVRFAYLLTMKDDRLYFMIDSEPVDSKDYSPPGQEYIEARPEDKKPFNDGKILVTQPTIDRWGTWVSILAPIKDEATGRVLVVFGIDYDADTWGKSILYNVFRASLVILIPLILLIFFSLKLLSKNKILANEIIERKSTEKTLRKSEEKFRSVTQSANDAIIIADSKGVIIDWNNSAEKMFGYTSREIISKNLELIIPQDYRDKHIKAIKLVEQGEKQHLIGKTVELHGLHKNGNEFPLELSLSEWKTPTGNYYTGIIRDITDRKHAEEELRKLSRAIVQSPVGIIITDPDGNIEFANPKFTENSNYSLEEIKGKNPRILKSGYHQKDFYEEMWDTILSGKDWVGEIYNKDKNGRFYWESSRISPIVNENGDIINFIGVKEDVTEKKKMIEDLSLAKEKAEQSDRLKTEFLAQMSHEIRSPMNAIISFANILKEEFEEKVTQELKEYFDGIDSAGNRLMRTVDLMLNTSEMQVGTYVPSFVKVKLISEILDNVKRDYSKLILDKGLVFSFISDVPEAIVYVDKYSIKQIFINLIDNAVKYTKTGSISVKVEKGEDIKIVKVTIEDTGIGMTEEFMTRMYQPFIQEDGGYSRRFEGNGLGLSLVKIYCELNKIEINVESKKGIGTKFTLLFTESK